MPEAAPAIFLSYASEDSEPARRICEALRSVGLEVWFDQAELKGGDAWDEEIRRRIRGCALFVPVISGNTETRSEGYFRLEWKLAVDRSHMISPDQPFLLPVALDGTPESSPRVPERFREVQWFRARREDEVQALAERARRLLGLSSRAVPTASGSAAPPMPVAEDTPSIAVLPFANLSTDQENEYFADGLAEELLNVLANIRGLRVASRTSAFFFKGKGVDLATIAGKLGVATILEGSVRKSGKRVRITTQLIEAATDSHLWSKTYDRELDDIFAVQDDIAQAVVAELKGKLLGEAVKPSEAAASEVKAAAVGRTGNAEAHELYLQARFLMSAWSNETNLKARELLERAVAIDPRFAIAWSELGVALFALADFGAIPAAEGYELSAAAVRKALEVEPGLAEGYSGLARSLAREWKWPEVMKALERARELAPNNARVLRSLGRYVAILGRPEEGIEYLRQARLLDPLAAVSHFNLGGRLLYAGHLDEAEAAYQRAFDINPKGGLVHTGLALTYLRQGRVAKAREMIEGEPVPLAKYSIVAMAEHSLGHRDRSDEALAALIAGYGELAPYQVASTCAWLGRNQSALDWLERAYEMRDPPLEDLTTDPFLEGLHGEPRYRALARKMGLPEPAAA